MLSIVHSGGIELHGQEPEVPRLNAESDRLNLEGVNGRARGNKRKSTVHTDVAHEH